MHLAGKAISLASCCPIFTDKENEAQTLKEITQRGHKQPATQVEGKESRAQTSQHQLSLEGSSMPGTTQMGATQSPRCQNPISGAVS